MHDQAPRKSSRRPPTPDARSRKLRAPAVLRALCGDQKILEQEGRRILAREAQARKACEVGTAAIGKDRVGTGAFARPAQAKPSANVGTDAFVRPASGASLPKAGNDTAAKVTPPPAAIHPQLERNRHPTRTHLRTSARTQLGPQAVGNVTKGNTSPEGAKEKSAAR
jgi:hypothetical protein